MSELKPIDLSPYLAQAERIVSDHAGGINPHITSIKDTAQPNMTGDKPDILMAIGGFNVQEEEIRDAIETLGNMQGYIDLELDKFGNFSSEGYRVVRNPSGELLLVNRHYPSQVLMDLSQYAPKQKGKSFLRRFLK